MFDKVIIDGLSFALPLFVMAIGGIYSERSGITNLALEGLQGAGAFVGALVAVVLMRILGTDSQIPYYAAMLFAMIGGMLTGLMRGANLTEAFRFGVAAGAASVMTDGTQLVRKADFDVLLPKVTVQEV